MKWALPAERGRELEKLQGSRLSRSNRAFVKGGYFRQFLSKYPESNLMYSKMIHTYDLVNQVRGDRYRKKAAREELWKGESHSAYWYGKHGGIHINSIRKAVYSALIAAEKTSRQRGVFKSHVSVEDFDLDGTNEYLCHGNDLNMYIHRLGGMVFELDYIAKPWNYLDTFTRSPENYDERLDKERVVDRYPRKAFVDHFFSTKERIESFANMKYSELGDFLNLPYAVKECRKDSLDLRFSAHGRVTVGGKPHPLCLEKRFRLKRASVIVDYTLKNTGKETLTLCFAPEINLSFSDNVDSCLGMSVQKAAGKLKEIDLGRRSEAGATGFQAKDKTNGVTVQGEWGRESSLWVLPVEAAWFDREGPHLGYESTCFLPVWDLSLPPENDWTISIQLAFQKTRR